MNDLNGIQTARISFPATVFNLKLPSYIRNQREYSKRRNMGATQVKFFYILK